MNETRRPLIAGNWKMHHGGPAGLELAGKIAALARPLPHVDLVIAPPFTALAACAGECEGTRVELAGQNLYPREWGAFTGEISGKMLLEAGCRWVIVGHSERRQLFGETDAVVTEKAFAALEARLIPILCVGETLSERESGQTLAVVERQVRAFLNILVATDVAAAIAYEPVWAIGTGKTAGPSEAQEVHSAIRGWLSASPSGSTPTGLASRTRILYGGSVKAENAHALLACADVDGALVGGASLDAASFGAIARAAEALAVG